MKRTIVIHMPGGDVTITTVPASESPTRVKEVGTATVETAGASNDYTYEDQTFVPNPFFAIRPVSG